MQQAKVKMCFANLFQTINSNCLIDLLNDILAWEIELVSKNGIFLF